jgi:hypothetical protein
MHVHMIRKTTHNPQDGVDEATGKLTQILHSISDKACKTFRKCGRNNM